MTTLASSFLIGTFSSLQETRTCIYAWMSLNFNQIRPLATELPALERLKNQLMYNVVNSSFLQVKRTTIKFQMS